MLPPPRPVFPQTWPRCFRLLRRSRSLDSHLTTTSDHPPNGLCYSHSTMLSSHTFRWLCPGLSFIARSAALRVPSSQRASFSLRALSDAPSLSPHAPPSSPHCAQPAAYTRDVLLSARQQQRQYTLANEARQWHAHNQGLQERGKNGSSVSMATRGIGSRTVHNTAASAKGVEPLEGIPRERGNGEHGGVMCTVLYNRSCPICRREIDMYKQRSTDVQYVDISDHDQPMRDEYARRLHVRTADGRELSGVSAFAEVWKHTSGFNWLPSLLEYKPVHTIATLIYEPLAWVLFQAHLWRSKKKHPSS
eukprot:TRINITY_DN1021_c0_g1_i3.p3 TRINITY_DN1021_c0_g1~~TRINITY_DN1021_c0_g1_i3.p3  ORF type:complete len:305 (+),score=34.09 TRINITY_DN1021_c0_g1_i3:2958-3872(+)